LAAAERLVTRFREIAHDRPGSLSKMRSGVSGSEGKRTPVTLVTALAMAGATGLTVIAEGPMRALAFDQAKLSHFFHNESEVAGLIYQLLGRELAQKIKVSNALVATSAG
jgi:hypothetical protein